VTPEVLVPSVDDIFPLPAQKVSEYTPEQWGAFIREAVTNSVRAIIDVGANITQCKLDLPHGQFLEALRFAGISPRVAQMFMKVANNPVLSNAKTSSHLPASYNSLYELTKLEEDRLEEIIAEGVVNAGTTYSAAKSLVRQEQIKAQHGEPRFYTEDDVHIPVVMPNTTWEPPKILLKDSEEWADAPMDAAAFCEECQQYLDGDGEPPGPDEVLECPKCECEVVLIAEKVTEELELWVMNLTVDTEAPVPLEAMVRVPYGKRLELAAELFDARACIDQMLGMLDSPPDLP